MIARQLHTNIPVYMMLSHWVYFASLSTKWVSIIMRYRSLA